MDCIDSKAQGSAKLYLLNQAMERWARWRWCGVTREVSLMGRLMDGMKSTRCPACRGSGRMPGYLVGSDLDFLQCVQCEGAGKVSGSTDPTIRRRTIHCPDCYDKAVQRSRGEYFDGFVWRTCIKCFGSGKKVFIYLKVNPAGIKGTRHYGANEDDDPTSMQIDRIVAGWRVDRATELLYWVTIYEHTEPGTQAEKADSIGKETGRKISQSYYSQLLGTANDALINAVFT